ncbi:unnamed protein product [Mucor circinelloides]
MTQQQCQKATSGDTQEDVLIEDQQMNQQQEHSSSDGKKYSGGISNVGGDGNELKHVDEAYGNISPYDEEFDSEISDPPSEEERSEITDSNINKSVINGGYDGISSANKLDDILLEVDKSNDIILEVDKLDDSFKVKYNAALAERAVDSECDNSSLHSPGSQSYSIISSSVSATAEEGKVKKEEEQAQLDEFADSMVVTTENDVTQQHSNNDQGEANDNIHDNQEEISSTSSSKMKEMKKAQAGKVESSGDVKKFFPPFAFVKKQSKKALPWQKFCGTENSLHKDEDVLGPVTGSEDVEGPTSVVAKGDVME